MVPIDENALVRTLSAEGVSVLVALATYLPEAVRVATVWREDRAADDTVRVGAFMWTLLRADAGHAVDAATVWLDDFAGIMEQAGVSVIIEWR